jgi:hypothetical protein
MSSSQNRHHAFNCLPLLFAISFAALLSCSSDTPVSLTPGLDAMTESPGNLALPVLRTTLPASWDENWYSSPALFDINHDGKNEIIASRHSVLYVWKNDGTKLWRAPVGENASSSNDHGSDRMYCSPVVGDLKGDGFGEIAIAYSNKAAVYDYKGNLLPGWPQSFPGPDGEVRSIAAADIDGDGTCEIAVVKTNTGPAAMIWRLDGTAFPGWPQVADRTDKQKNDYGGYNQNIGIADVNGDGKKEIVCTYDICHIGVFFADGRSFPANPMFSGSYSSSVPMFHDIALAKQGWGPDGNDRDEFTDSPPVFADLDGDGIAEIVLYADHERAGDTRNRGNSLWALRPDMSRLSGFEKPITTGMPLYTGYEDNIVQVAPAPCIFKSADGRPHIVVPSYDGFMHCYSSRGIEEWKIQFDAAGAPFIGAGEATAGDLDGDNIPEIVFTTYSTEKDRSFLVILGNDGTLKRRIPISGRGSMAAPTLADVDGDGKIEIILSLKDVLGGGIGGVQIWDVSSATTGRLDWPTGRGNFLRTGNGFSF